jgi:predicted nuclease of restriction endonuclease-like (RecB) superfamily
MKYLQLVSAIQSTSQQLVRHSAFVVNQALVVRNWLVGAYLVEFEQHGKDRAKYGAQLMQRLAADLARRGLKGLGASSLKHCRQFYVTYPQIRQPLVGELGTRLNVGQIGQPPVGESVEGKISAPVVRKSLAEVLPLPKLVPSAARRRAVGAGLPLLSPELVLRFSWSKLLELIRLDDPLKRAFYETECLKGNWSKRQLQRQIGSLLYERTGLSTNKRAVVARAHRQEPPANIDELVRDPYVLEFTGLATRPEYTESDLEAALLDDLQAFILELGTGFCFEARQFRVTLGNEHDYVDLVFYHRHLRCHVLLDLKVRGFKHADAGQMNYYLNFFKQRMRGEGDNPPVGILLCSDKDQTKVEFATAGMDNKLFVSRYLLALPSVEQLRRFVEADRARFEAEHSRSRKSK